MQIDGHHTLTYVLARMVGFNHEESNIIGHSAQYVDDATNSGLVEFDNGAMFSRISSAHGVYDMKNHLNAHENHLVWVPFHFLPGNDGKPAGENPKGSFINKLVCKPESEVAYNMLDACMEDVKKPYFLHRLGITMHVFADTFAHKGFAGIIHNVNKVKNLTSLNYDMDFIDHVKSKALSRKFPMGHGAALTFPDMPFLKWSYTNGLGENIERNNLDDFNQAAHYLFNQLARALYAYDSKREINPPDNEDNTKNFNQIKTNFETFRYEKGDERHKKWIDSIANTEFSFGSVQLEYIAKGSGSWKDDAIGQKEWRDVGDEVFEYNDKFMNSHWRHFHIALKKHRFDVVNDILPQYGIIVS